LRDAHPAPEPGEHELGPLLLRPPGDREGDRALGEHAGDQQSSSLEEHVASHTARSGHGYISSTRAYASVELAPRVARAGMEIPDAAAAEFADAWQE
jgi:hypothetical protein